MDIYSGHMNKLIEQLSRLPGVGAKSAQRLAFHIINMPKEDVQSIADAMVSAKENVHYCKECFTLTDDELCPICKDPKRNHKQIMVVEHTRDMAAYEKTGKEYGYGWKGSGFSDDRWTHDNPFDWGLSFQAGLEIGSWMINVGYDASLGKEYEYDSVDLKYHTFSLSVEYKFKLGK